jgi:hypothetical protein
LEETVFVAIGRKLNKEEIRPSGAGTRDWIPTLEVIPLAKYGKTEFYECEHRNITFPNKCRGADEVNHTIIANSSYLF